MSRTSFSNQAGNGMLHKMKIPKDLWRVAGLVLSAKAVIFSLAIGAALTLPGCDSCHEEAFLYQGVIQQPVERALQTWDTQHYLAVAQDWYRPMHPSNAFYPLLPVLIIAASVVTGGNLVAAGLLVSTTGSVATFLLLFVLIEKLYARKTAWRVVWLMITFPTAFFLHFIYSEGIFLFLIVAGFFALYTKRWWLVVLSHLLLPLTRATGLLVAGGHALFALENLRKRKRYVAAGAAVAAGFLIYLLLMLVFTGSAFTGFTLQADYFGNYSAGNIFLPLAWVRQNVLYFNTESTTLLAYQLMNRFFFLLYLVLLPWLFKWVRRDLFWYCVVVGGITALSGNLASWARYMLPLFPLFIPLARLLRGRYTFILWCVAAASVQAVLVVLHALNYWVA